MMNAKEALLAAAGLPGSSSGAGGVTPAQLQTALAAKQDKAASVTVTGTAADITPAVNTVYRCGTLTALTVSNPPAAGAFAIVFTSGATATTTTVPATVLGLEDFAAKPNTVYEIDVLDNRAVVGSWAVS